MEDVLYQTVQLAAKQKNTKKKVKEETTQVTTDTDTAATTDTETTTETSTQAADQQSVLELNWANPSWDLFLFLFFAVGALLYGMSLGKDRIIAIMVSIYMAVAIIGVLPEFVLNFQFDQNVTIEMTAFVALFAILFFSLSRSALLSALSVKAQGTWWQVIVFSILHVGLLISVVMTFLPADVLANFSQQTQDIFLQEWAKFAWMVAPVVAMLLLGGREED